MTTVAGLLATEIAAFGAALLFLLLSLGKRPAPRRDFVLALAAAAIVVLSGLATLRSEGVLFAEAYRVDLFSQVFKVLLAMGLFLVICLCGGLSAADIAERHRPEFFMLLFTCTLAMMLLCGSVHLLSAYVALELSSYSLYVLVALRQRREMAMEATVKFFIMGITASALMLFGLALLYGTTGAATTAELARALTVPDAGPLARIGLVLTFSGFFFKLAVFPFHFWAPDAYQGASHPVAAYLATASKIAAIALLVRLVAAGAGGGPYLAHALAGLSILSMTVGNLAAIAQKDLKRLFAYSSVAQAGYALIGILSLSAEGYAAAMFYALALLVMKFTCFLVIVAVAFEGANIEVAQLAGLYRRAPLLALALMFSVFSLAGIPPTIGFTGKFLIFNAAVKAGHLALVLIAMVNVVVSLYYYLLIVKAAYLLEPAAEAPPLRVPPALNLLAGLLVAVMVAAGFYPQWVLSIAREAAAAIAG
jgi:NADH-quinone oxidoreductase subunit N